MPFIFKKSKRGASKLFYQTIKSQLQFKNIVLISVGALLGCLFTVMFFCYYLKVNLDNNKSFVVDNKSTVINNNSENIVQMPKFNFYHFLPKNTTVDINKTEIHPLDDKTKTINSKTDNLEPLPQPLILNKKNSLKKYVAYSLQIGLFLHLKQAQTILAKVENLGFVAIIEKVKIKSKKEWFRVEVGPFFSLKDFNYAQNKILGQNINGMLLQCRKKNYIK